MAWSRTDEPAAFEAAAGAFLRARPVEHTVALTVTDALARRGPGAYGEAAPVLAWWEEGGEVRGALVRTPPLPALVTDLPDAAAAPTAELLAALDADAVDAPAATAERLAAAWEARTQGAPGVRRRQRLHRLAALVPPQPAPPGHAVLAGEGHRELLVAWIDAFTRDTGASSGRAATEVSDRLARGGLLLWVRAEPVSLAGRTPTVAGVARIAPVFTPPDHRGRGYAAAATAAAVRAAREDGASEVVLFTDLANPVSNRLYARLGFRPVEDRAVLALSG